MEILTMIVFYHNFYNKFADIKTTDEYEKLLNSV